MHTAVALPVADNADHHGARRRVADFVDGRGYSSTPIPVILARWPVSIASGDVIDREQATAIVAKRQHGRLLIVADRANDDITMHTPLREDRAHGPDTRDCRIARRSGTGTASRLAGYRFSSVAKRQRGLGGACFSHAVRKWAGGRGWFGALPPGVGSADDVPFLRQGQAVVGLLLSGAPCATPSWAWGIAPGG